MKRYIKFIAVILAVTVVLLIPFAVKHLVKKADMAAHPILYSEYVDKYSDEYGVPRAICYAVIKCESSFRHDAVSRSGAMGLMQMKPTTFFDLCSRQKEEHNESMLYDPETSIKYGIYYLSLLYKRFGVWETAVAAYNCGQGRVAGWIKDGLADESGRLTEIPIAETKTYVSRVTKAREKYEKLYNL